MNTDSFYSPFTLLEHEQLKEFNEQRWEHCLAKALKASKRSKRDPAEAKPVGSMETGDREQNETGNLGFEQAAKRATAHGRRAGSEQQLHKLP